MSLELAIAEIEAAKSMQRLKDAEAFLRLMNSKQKNIFEALPRSERLGYLLKYLRKEL